MRDRFPLPLAHFTSEQANNRKHNARVRFARSVGTMDGGSLGSRTVGGIAIGGSPAILVAGEYRVADV